MIYCVFVSTASYVSNKIIRFKEKYMHFTEFFR
jgi:hypothetical protein